jgi:hypothetical protein
VANFAEDVNVGGLLRVQQQVSGAFFSFAGPGPEFTFGGPDAPGIYPLVTDPTVFPGYPAPEGSLGVLVRAPWGLWQKTGNAPTEWTAFAASGGPGPSDPTTLTLQSPITPAAISGNVNDYAPAGGDGTSWWRLQASPTTAVITGIALGKTSGRLLFIQNVGSTNPIGFLNESGSSLAANRIHTPDGQTWVIPPGGCAIALYDGTLGRFELQAVATNTLPDTLILGTLDQSGGDVALDGGSITLTATGDVEASSEGAPLGQVVTL